MEIRFLNHSSYIFHSGAVSILVDPWFDGRVFQDGWALLCPTPFEDKDFSSITHIWMSHEHPDHFHPPTLKRIPEADRKRIVILFPRTPDGRVVKFLRAQGFTHILQMAANRRVELGEGVTALCSLFGEIDSWLYVQAEGKGILNTNDCGIRTRKCAQKILGALGGPVDLLLTQFSYAYWKGNPDQKRLREEEADRKLKYMKLQVEEFRPKDVIPIASFIWFCHEENFFLNDSINTPRKARDFLQKETNARAVILHPGESFSPGAVHDSDASLRRYEETYAQAIRPENCVKTRLVDEAKLQESAGKFITRLKATAPWWLHKALPPTTIHLSDWNRTLSLSPAGLSPSSVSPEMADVSCTSESMEHCLRFSWGIDTMGINGRYQRPARGKYERFYRYFRFDLLSERGIHVGPSYVLESVSRKVLTRLGLYTP